LRVFKILNLKLIIIQKKISHNDENINQTLKQNDSNE